MKEALGFRYPFSAATQAPSKQTATQQKGRRKDQEAAENAQLPKQIHRSWRMPSFRDSRQQGKMYGNAIHAVMQHLDFAGCTDADSVERQISRLVTGRLLTKEQADMVDCSAIAAFFQTELGEKLRNGTPCIREFKFSILDDASHYGDGLDGEQVLLQGVVDCALLEEDGITVIDFKTDAVTEQTLPQLTARYGSQLKTYAHALERIYRKQVKKSCLYFFRLSRFVEI